MDKVYICTPLHGGKFNLDLIQKTILERNVFAFIPAQGQLENKTLGAILDRKMLDEASEVFVFGPIGRDCSWEIGYATGKGKKVTIFLDKTNQDILEDWMTIIDVEIVHIQ